MKQSLIFAAFCTGGLPLAASSASAAVYHVSPSPLSSVTAKAQFRTISEAAKIVQPGDTVLIHTGVYRETVSVTAAGTSDRPILFQAAPAANVVITGADHLTGWMHEPGPDNVYSVAWPYSFIGGPTYAHPDDDYHLLIGRAEQVFAGGYPLHQVLKRSEMNRGTFYADLETKRLSVWRADNREIAPDDTTLEASTRQTLWQGKGVYVSLRGVRFRYAANAAQQQAAEFDGRSDVVEDCVFEQTNGVGVGFHAPNQIARRCTFQNNGQMGLGVYSADRLLVTDCLIEGNNTKGFSRDWEAGGEKTVLARGVIYDHCRVLNNHGIGLWFDIGNENCEVRNSLIAGNEDAGIFYEISYGLHVHDNVIIGNGLADTPGQWGAAAGVSLSSSPGCVIERNLIIGNKEGFNFREQQRTTWRIGFAPGSKEIYVWNHDSTIRHNVLADNRDAQTWGWFDMWDERQWPRILQVNNRRERPATFSQVDFDRGYIENIAKGAPQGLSLETLHFTFAGNLYDAPDGQGLFHWGTLNLHHRFYDSLSMVRQELNLEQGSLAAPFVFSDYLTRDFRVPAGSLAVKMGCYPIGTVPGVHLGMFVGKNRNIN